MPAMLRQKGKARKIAYNLLGKNEKNARRDTGVRSSRTPGRGSRVDARLSWEQSALL